MMESVKVGMADLNICKSPDSITTLGLGSCVGISVWDPITKIGGMAHIMLPDSNAIRNNTCVAKFADTGIEELVKRVVAAGAARYRLTAKIAGGATMFSFGAASEAVRVGERNVEATIKKLNALGIPIVAQDTGDTYGRTIIFFPETGALIIRSVGRPEKTI